jgi:hypothetical protein
MRHARHRLPCACTATNQLETNLPCSHDNDAAAIGRRSHGLDVQARLERSPDTPQIAIDGPVDARKPLNDRRVSMLHHHEANQPSQTGRADAENSCRSKL